MTASTYTLQPPVLHPRLGQLGSEVLLVKLRETSRAGKALNIGESSDAILSQKQHKHFALMSGLADGESLHQYDLT